MRRSLGQHRRSFNRPDRSERTRDTSADLALRNGRVDEERPAGRPQFEGPEGYRKMLQRLIHRRMQDEAVSYRYRGIQRAPGIGFCLYANDDAHLIEVERSSGGKELDQGGSHGRRQCPTISSIPSRALATHTSQPCGRTPPLGKTPSQCSMPPRPCVR
jgi:hypothetical protein